MTSLLRFSRPAVWCLLAVPLLAFAWLLYAYALNVPWYDDIEAFVGFMASYRQATTASEKLYWLLKPNNEHRIFFAKLTAVATTGLTGELNFRTLILVGGVFLLGTLGLLLRVLRWQRALPLVLFAPVPFLLLQPQYHLTSLWAITSLQHIAVTFFMLCGFWALANWRSTGRFWLAVGLQTGAALSMSTGLFGWIAGAGLLFVQRRWAKLAIWSIVGAAVIAFYFHDFTSPQGNESSVSFFLKHPHLVFFGFFTFIGGLFDFLPTQPILWRSVLPTLAGMMMVSATVYRLGRQNWLRPERGAEPALLRQRYFFLGMYGFLLINAAAIGFLRPRFGYEVMLVSNYMLYPPLWVCLLYLHWVCEQRPPAHHRSLTIGLLGGVLVWAVSYNLHWPAVHERRQRLLAYAFDQRNNGAGLAGTLGTPLADYIDKQMRGAVDGGYYHYPAVHAALPDSLLKRPAQSTAPFEARPATVVEQPTQYPIELLPNVPFAARNPTFLLLQSEQHTYLLANQAPLRLISFALNRPVVAAKADALKSILWPGQYRLGWVTVVDGEPQIRYTGQMLSVTQ